MPRCRIRIAVFLFGLGLALAPTSAIVDGQVANVNEAVESRSEKNESATVTPDSKPAPSLEWRRTVNGWEPSVAWADAGSKLAPPAVALNLHPMIVAMLQALISVGALLLFEHTDEDEATDLIHMLKR